jgi:hypothetical protein
LENLEKMEKYLDPYGYPQPNHENLNQLNGSIMSKEIEASIRVSPKK